MKLRPYQQNNVNEIFAAWNAGYKNVLYVLPTGGGKTVVFAEITRLLNTSLAAVAHRKELVAQMSLTLARVDVRHRIIAPPTTVKFISNANYKELKIHSTDPNAMVGAVSVDTLKSHYEKEMLKSWSPHVRYWIQDEAHHVLKENKWGKVPEIFPNARGLGVTATPLRADGQGLGRHNDGVFDCIVEGPTMRWLIDQGYLSDYRIICPPSDIDESVMKIGANGDYTLPSLKKAAEHSHIVGDVVKHFIKYSDGMQGITFATDVETGSNIHQKYLEAGVKSAFVDAKTPEAIRAEIIRRFRSGQLQQMVNVDLFGEGFDLPSLGVVSGARATQSFGLASQQFGRALRPEYAPGYNLETQTGRLAAIAAGPKPKAIYLDHVGNFAKGNSFGRHALPDAPRVWTLDRIVKKQIADPNIDPLKSCLNPGCFKPYNGYLSACPFCGFKPEPAKRSEPKFVDGDLMELDAATLRKLRGEVEKVDRPGEDVFDESIRQGQSEFIAAGRRNKHNEKKEAQQLLRESMGFFGGIYNQQGKTDSYIQRKFYNLFNIDVQSAKALNRIDAVSLTNKINEVLQNVKTN